ncbi:pantetheine-phosphate adenylyltransferase [Candidatus Avelusimicrobium aviculae]|uniref:pantetheine-phosphate adenylyltransferase n=1 Tax=Candidatus Avelusimicrobium aviculae TaxID=3416206 RepID=UPI003D0EE0B3
MKPVVYAGSFDPITNGHVDIIRRAARVFGTVRVVVLSSPHKKPLFSVQERLDLIRKNTADIPGVSVAGYGGLLVDYLAQEGLSVVVRGVRGVADAEEEASYAYANRLLAPFVEFVWLPADPKFCFVSSSAVRESFSYGREIPGYVSEETARALRVKFPAKNLPSCSKDPEKN